MHTTYHIPCNLLDQDAILSVHGIASMTPLILTISEGRIPFHSIHSFTHSNDLLLTVILAISPRTAMLWHIYYYSTNSFLPIPPPRARCLDLPAVVGSSEVISREVCQDLLILIWSKIHIACVDICILGIYTRPRQARQSIDLVGICKDTVGVEL